MPSEGLQRLQRLSAAANASQSNAAHAAKSTPPRARHGGAPARKSRLTKNVLFLPLLALFLVAVGVLTPGLGDFLPHSRAGIKQIHGLDLRHWHGADPNQHNNRKLITGVTADVADTGVDAGDAAAAGAHEAQGASAAAAAEAEQQKREQAAAAQAHQAAAAHAAGEAEQAASEAAAQQAGAAAAQQQQAEAAAAAQAAQQRADAAAAAAAADPGAAVVVDVATSAAAADQDQAGGAGGGDQGQGAAQLTDEELDALVQEATQNMPEEEQQPAATIIQEAEVLPEGAAAAADAAAVQPGGDAATFVDGVGSEAGGVAGSMLEGMADAAVAALEGGEEVGDGLLMHDGDDEDEEADPAAAAKIATAGAAAALADAAGDHALEELLRTAGEKGEQGTLMEGEDREEQRKAAAAARAAGCDPRCTWHGACSAEGRCQCAPTYAGVACANPVLLSWPFVPPGMTDFSARFEGSFVLTKDIANLQGMQVNMRGPGGSTPGPVVIADRPLIEQLTPLLAESDPVAKGAFHDSCAVVGSSASLLHYELGNAIDEHDMVMRFNSAPTEGVKFSVGSKTTHRVTDLGNWGYHESNLEAVLVPASAEALKGLVWNAAQPEPRNVHVLHPEFETYVRGGFDFEPDTGMYGLLLALHRCRVVRLYGFSMTAEPGVPYHYYDGCDTSADPLRDAKQRGVLQALAGAGLLSFGEPCTSECSSDPAAEACQVCRVASGYLAEPPNYPQAEDCVPGEGSRGHNPAPWLQQQAVGQQEQGAETDAQALAQRQAAEQAAQAEQQQQAAAATAQAAQQQQEEAAAQAAQQQQEEAAAQAAQQQQEAAAAQQQQEVAAVAAEGQQQQAAADAQEAAGVQ